MSTGISGGMGRCIACFSFLALRYSLLYLPPSGACGGGTKAPGAPGVSAPPPGFAPTAAVRVATRGRGDAGSGAKPAGAATAPPRRCRATPPNRPQGSPSRSAVCGTLNPILIPDPTSLALSRLFFSGLVTISPKDGAPSPDLAEAWTVSDDGLTYAFTLRPSVPGATIRT